jgi:hypothetical protein
MLTPKLEELILCGRAFAKTFVASGAKSMLNINNDRFIIITDITFLPTFPRNVANNNIDTVQVSILGEKGFNHYMFKNRVRGLFPIWNTVDFLVQPSEAFVPANVQTINTYLLHTTQVGFTFLNRPDNQADGPFVVSSFDNPAYQSILDYGKEGDPTTVAFSQTVTNDTLRNFLMNPKPTGGNNTDQYQYPAQNNTRPVYGLEPDSPAPYILNVNYVEILGQPNNIGF